jgi:hypothetical protein
MMVVVNDRNDVLGTLLVDARPSGKGAPQSFGIRARPGERVVEIEVDDAMSALEPAELHAALAKQHLKTKSRMLVVVNDQNDVLGTLVVDARRSSKDAPESFGIQARPGERILEIEVDDATSALAPAELHAVIAQQHLH